MTIKHQFIRGVSIMNINSLEVILVKNAFKGFTNVSFLEKLKELFTELKAIGNTSLELHKGIGACGCNKGNKVFCFVANKTNDYFVLSYKEDENNYHNFSTSCSEVLYDNKPQLNKFHYFSIKPESTTEYLKHQESSNPICEYNAFSSSGLCSMETIELWLERHSDFYKTTVAVLEDKRLTIKLGAVNLLVKKEFEKLYGKMDVLRKLYNKEAYFMQQLEEYDTVKDSVSKLEKWFAYQEEYKNEYQLFSSVFYDSRELTHYCLKLDDLILDPNDFKRTLEYMSIIEDNKAIEFQGTIKTIDDLEVYEKTETTRAYTRRKIALSIDDFCCSEYQVVFTDGRAKHLDNISVGQFVKVFARVTGGEWENLEGIKEYKHNLFGWRVEKLAAKPITKENKKEMDLYYKYILPPPF